MNEKKTCPDLESKRGIKRLFFAFSCSLKGLKRAFATETPIKQEIIALAIAIPVAFLLAPNFSKACLLIGAILMLIVIELINTAIEKLCDHITPEFHDAIGYIKDLCSVAVLLTLLCVITLWLIILWPF